ncbi:hypothetical protein FQN54_006149 [Arachnomyces sp. PD_36]|nr:hypothetical protein FQN54_006149 [Arachnomyces sp. PD_36]
MWTLSSMYSLWLGLLEKDSRLYVSKTPKASKSKNSKPRIELTKAEAEKDFRSQEITDILSDGTFMFLALPGGLRQSEKLNDKIAAEALAAAKVPITQINRHDKKGFLVRMHSSDAVKRYDNTVVTIQKTKIKLRPYHVSQQRTFTISNIGVYAPDDVARGIWELVGQKNRFSMQIAYIRAGRRHLTKWTAWRTILRLWQGGPRMDADAGNAKSLDQPTRQTTAHSKSHRRQESRWKGGIDVAPLVNSRRFSGEWVGRLGRSIDAQPSYLDHVRRRNWMGIHLSD